MSKKIPNLETEEQVDGWLQSADLAEYNLPILKVMRFELSPKSSTISLRLPERLLATFKALARKADIPTQRLIRAALKDYIAKASAAGSPRKTVRATKRKAKAARKAA
jgi:predicted DNA binding CopG/RHH family protein